MSDNSGIEKWGLKPERCHDRWHKIAHQAAGSEACERPLSGRKLPVLMIAHMEPFEDRPNGATPASA